jgi:heme/copper-type cytochrome/quinol oxidase subunit 1
MGIAILLFVVNAVRSWRNGVRVGADPWRADTLEWYAASPPAPHNFERVPYISSARPLRDLRVRLQEQRR